MRASLEPFAGAVVLSVALPPIYAALFLAGRYQLQCLAHVPNGPVCFNVWLDIGDMTVDEMTDWSIDHASEIIAEAKRLCVSEGCRN